MISHRHSALASFASLCAVGALSASMAACGASDSGGKTGGPATTPTATTPTVLDLGGGDCHLHTSYNGTPLPGDSQCITPPAPEAGMQFHYGPTNYNDPVEVGKYILMPGGEVTDCVFFTTPNKEAVYFDAYHSRMRPGSHHMLLYVQPQGGGGPTVGNSGGISFGGSTVTETGTNGPSQCNQGLATRNLFGAQTPNLDVNALTAGAPENDGLAVELPATQQGVLQAHFINATSQPILREVWANVLFVPKSQVTQLGDPIFFIGGYAMNVKMGTTQAITGHATVPMNAAPDFRLVIGTGHYHSHTTEFKAWKTINGQKEVLIHDYNTLGIAPDPQTWYFDSAKQNIVPDGTTQTSGAYSGIVHLQPGDRIDWECDITNNNVPGGITFGNYVYTAEMCNMFGMYVPSMGGPWQASNP